MGGVARLNLALKMMPAQRSICSPKKVASSFLPTIQQVAAHYGLELQGNVSESGCHLTTNQHRKLKATITIIESII